MRRAGCAMLLVGLLGAVVHADVEIPAEHVEGFARDRRAYAIASQDEEPMRLRLFRVADGEPAIDPDAERRIGVSGRPRAGDAAVFETNLSLPVERLVVTGDARAVVCLRTSHLGPRPLDRGPVLEVIGGGVPGTRSVTLEELFDAAHRSRFTRGSERVEWLQSAWIDAETGDCVVVSSGGVARGVRTAEGGVHEVADEVLARAVIEQDQSEAVAALAVLTAREWDGLTALLRRVALHSDTHPLVRVLALAQLAATDVSDDELGAWIGEIQSREELYDMGLRLHLRWCPRLLEARPVSEGGEQRQTALLRVGAARLMGFLPASKRDLDALLAAAAADDERVARAAVAALARCERREARSGLRRLLAGDPRHTRALAGYYAEYGDDGVVPLLVDALERAVAAGDDAVADAVVGALRHQTGIDAGRDPAGWRRWLER